MRIGLRGIASSHLAEYDYGEKRGYEQEDLARTRDPRPLIQRAEQA